MIRAESFWSTAMVDSLLQNFNTIGDQKQLPPVLAAIDIGTNSIHTVIVQIKPDLPAFSIVGREKDTVRLGDRDKATGNLKEDAMVKSIEALHRHQEMAKSLGATQIIAVATSATREAPNGRAFIDRIDAELGLKVDLISGQEEARRIYLGVLSGIEFNNTPRIMIDIGGGSTELILGDSEEPRTLSSTKVGAVRLSVELVKSDPINDAEFAYLQAYVRGQLERPIDDIKSQLQAGEKPQMVGTSGTIETVAMIIARDKTGSLPSRLNGFQLNLKDVKTLIHKLRRLNNSDRAQLAGMSERRAEIIIQELWFSKKRC